MSEQRTDPGWMARFFTAAEDVSDEQMRSLWAQILAGEVAQPGRFSLRTLDIVQRRSSAPPSGTRPSDAAQSHASGPLLPAASS